MKYFLFILVGCALGFLAAKLLIKPKETYPVVIHTDDYRVKYETSFEIIRKQYIKIDSLKKIPKPKFIIVYEKTNDSIRTDNIPRSFLELSEYLCR